MAQGRPLTFYLAGDQLCADGHHLIVHRDVKPAAGSAAAKINVVLNWTAVLQQSPRCPVATCCRGC